MHKDIQSLIPNSLKLEAEWAAQTPVADINVPTLWRRRHTQEYEVARQEKKTLGELKPNVTDRC